MTDYYDCLIAWESHSLDCYQCQNWIFYDPLYQAIEHYCKLGAKLWYQHRNVQIECGFYT